MNTLDQARETQINNILNKTGKTMDELRALVAGSGMSKHSELRQLLIDRFGLGYGDANSLVHLVMKSDGQSAAEGMSADEVLDAIYSGGKAGLRPLHDAVMAMVKGFGDFESVPKKAYLALRRKKQFATIGPGTKGRLEVGLNMKGVEPAGLLEALPPGGMCQYRILLESADQVDEALRGWLRQAYDSAG